MTTHTPSIRRALLVPLFAFLLILLGTPTIAHAQYATHQKISDTEGDFTGVLDDDDLFGWSSTSLGDLDGDGINDLAVGAPYDDDGATNTGGVWILFMNADGTVKNHQKISDTEGGFTGTLDDFDNFGWSVAALSDLDGDGINDLAVGAPYDDDGATNTGGVWILFMNAKGTVKNHQKISDTEGGFTGILDDYDLFGFSVASLGDLNGDGTKDLAVGALLDGDGGMERGAVWILFLNSDGTVKSHQKISDTEGGFTGVLDDNDNFGISVAALGDLDDDGTDDLAVGAYQDDDGGMNHGAIWILFLNSDGTVESHQKISDTKGGFTGTLDDFDSLGWSVALVGDLDGDGIDDLVTGAVNEDDGGQDRGAVWVLFMNSDGTVKRHEKISDTEGGFTGTLDDEDYFGVSVAGINDLNGDGSLDFAVSAPYHDDGGEDRGAVWILFRENPALTPTHDANTALAIGSTFTLTLDIGTPDYPVNDLFGIGASLHYDPALLQIQSVIDWPFLKDSAPLITFEDIDNTNGRADFSVVRERSARGVSGHGVVVQLDVNVIGTGNALLTLSDAFAIRADGSSFVPHLETHTIPLFSVLVWPGDADNNGTVEVADVMAIGTNYEKTGPARSDRTFDWSPKGVLGAWGIAEAVYADALGDGTVNQNDVLPIGFNLGLTTRASKQQGRTASPAAKAVADVSYRLRIYHNRRKQQARARLVLTDAADLLGTAVTLHYDPNVYRFRSHSAGPLLDDGDLLSLDAAGDGTLAVAYTRKAPNGSASGRGPVLDVLFDVIGAPHDEAMTLQTLTLGTTQGSIAVVGPDAIAARAERGLDTAPAEPVVAKTEEEQPVAFALQGAYPNPFNPATTIAFDLPERAEVNLIVLDLLGREVRRIDVGSVAAGTGQTVRFEASDLPSGVYLYRLEAQTAQALHSASGKVMLLK